MTREPTRIKLRRIGGEPTRTRKVAKGMRLWGGRCPVPRKRPRGRLRTISDRNGPVIRKNASGPAVYPFRVGIGAPMRTAHPDRPVSEPSGDTTDRPILVRPGALKKTWAQRKTTLESTTDWAARVGIVGERCLIRSGLVALANENRGECASSCALSGGGADRRARRAAGPGPITAGNRAPL